MPTDRSSRSSKTPLQTDKTQISSLAKTSSAVAGSSRTSTIQSDDSRSYGPERDPQFHPRLDQLKKAIPRHCFKIDTAMGVYHLAKDYCQIAVVYFSSPLFEAFGFPGLVVWYCVLTVFFFSLFSVAHDGWHRSLSTNPVINDFVGHLASSPMMMPFYPFRMSHQKHHAHTNHIGKDAHHVWYTEETIKEVDWWKLTIKHFPLTQPFTMHVFYLIFGFVDGSHYWPFGAMYKTPFERLQCAVSSLACIAYATTFLWLFDWNVFLWIKYYIVPVLFLGLLINIVTYLQHFDYISEAYGDEEWRHLRAQLQTIDRTYGFGIEYFGHNMTNGHVCHHLFNRIPHYNLIEGTEALKKALEPYKGTPYEYKHVKTYDFLPRHLVYQYYLDYLVERTKGIFHFRVRRDHEEKVQ